MTSLLGLQATYTDGAKRTPSESDPTDRRRPPRPDELDRCRHQTQDLNWYVTPARAKEHHAEAERMLHRLNYEADRQLGLLLYKDEKTGHVSGVPPARNVLGVVKLSDRWWSEYFRWQARCVVAFDWLERESAAVEEAFRTAELCATEDTLAAAVKADEDAVRREFLAIEKAEREGRFAAFKARKLAEAEAALAAAEAANPTDAEATETEEAKPAETEARAGRRRR